VSPEAWGGLTVLAVALLREAFTLWDQRQRRAGKKRTRRQDSDNPSRSASEVELLDLLRERDL
jgi:Flp pilus assembly protein TadB